MLPEIAYKVFDYLETKDIIRLGILSKQFHELTKNYVSHKYNSRMRDALLKSYNDVANMQIITAPTQVGKTQFMINLIQKLNCIVVIVSENRIDQQNQLKERFNSQNVKITPLDSPVQEIQGALNGGSRVCFSILNNPYKIKKLSKCISQLEFKNIFLFRDEGDTHLRQDTKYSLEWAKMYRIFDKSVFMKTFFVTATPKKCLNLTLNVVEIPSPVTYRHVNRFIEWDGEDLDPLSSEITRIRSERKGEFIIYSATTIMVQFALASRFSKDYNCTCITYNHKGIHIYENFTCIKYKNGLSELLTEYRNHHKPIVLIGGSMVKRGLSFCGKGNGSLTATVIFYHAKSPNIDNLVQKIGRVTGVSRPDLNNRKVYTSPGIISKYKKYMEEYKRFCCEF